MSGFASSHPYSLESLERRQLFAAGLAAYYYDNPDFTGTSVTRVDAQVDFNWGHGSPAHGFEVDTFSVRWIGSVQADKTQTYTFHTNSDEGVRLWVGGKLLINDWSSNSYRENS